MSENINFWINIYILQKKLTMKYFLFIWIAAGLFIPAAVSQNSVQDYINKGIEFHDQGKYMKAVEQYKKALDIDPKSPGANYELAYTYLSLKDYKNTIKYSTIVINMNNDYSVQGYIIKGTAYDDSGQPKKAEKTYLDGIKKYGTNYLLCYNLAVTQVGMKKYTEAEEALKDGLHNKASHPGSNLLLAYINLDNGKKVNALLALHYFLLCESGTQRAEKAAKTLIDTYNGIASVSVDDSGKTQVHITINSSDLNTAFNMDNFMFALSVGNNMTDTSKNKSKISLFMANTETLVNQMLDIFDLKDSANNAIIPENDELDPEKLKEAKLSSNIYKSLYAASLYEIVKSDHFETYCYYIMSGADKEAAKWIEDNKDKVSEFAEWLNNNDE